MKKQNNKPKKDKQPNRYLQFTSIAFQMGGAVFLGNYFGKWLDKKYQTDYLANIVTLLAVFAAMYLVISQVIKISKEDD